MLKRTTMAFAMAFLVLLIAAPGLGQETSGSVSGTITDPDGNPMPGVTVTLTGTGFPSGTVAVTGGNGRYRFPNVPPGTYTMSAALDGFANIEAPEFRVNIESALDADFQMALAAVTEAIMAGSSVRLGIRFNALPRRAAENLPGRGTVTTSLRSVLFCAS